MRLYRFGDSLKYVFNFLLTSSLREFNRGAGINEKDAAYLFWSSGMSLSRSKINLPGINTSLLIKSVGFSLLLMYQCSEVKNIQNYYPWWTG